LLPDGPNKNALMISRVLLTILLLLSAYSVGVAQGATLFLPTLEKRLAVARIAGGASQVTQIADKCKSQGGFILQRMDGGADLFMCLGPVDGYMLEPDGKPIKPQKKPLHPKESQRF
jgi:hypothetical protein